MFGVPGAVAGNPLIVPLWPAPDGSAGGGVSVGTAPSGAPEADSPDWPGVWAREYKISAALTKPPRLRTLPSRMIISSYSLVDTLSLLTSCTLFFKL